MPDEVTGRDALSHELSNGRDPSPDFAYEGRSACPIRRVPGSAEGAEVYVLRDWKSVVEAMRNPKLRSLRNVAPCHAIAGVTLQHADGLLRRDPPETDVRRLINPFFTAQAVERWRDEIRVLSVRYAQALGTFSGPVDLSAAFCVPLSAEVLARTTGLSDREWTRLNELSDQTTGMLVLSPADHEAITQSWTDLYEFCAAVLARMREERRGGPGDSIMADVVAALEARGLPEEEVLHVCATVLNGFPTTIPAFKVAAEELLHHLDVVEACRRDPKLWPKVLQELLRLRAHFSFALPGEAQEDFDVDGFTVPKGGVVLPAIHAAERDPSHVPHPETFDLGRARHAILAFGVGVHVCPGKALTLLLMEEGFRALVETNPNLRLAVPPEEIVWKRGTMPMPERIPVLVA